MKLAVELKKQRRKEVLKILVS